MGGTNLLRPNNGATSPPPLLHPFRQTARIIPRDDVFLARKANSIYLLYLLDFQPLAKLARSTNIFDQTEFFSFVWRMSTYDVTTANVTKVGLVKF